MPLPRADRTVRRVSDSALLVETRDIGETVRLHATLAADALPGVIDLLPAARTVLVSFDPHRVSGGELARHIRSLSLSEAPPEAGGVVQIPVRYDEEDLDEVATQTGLSREHVVGLHTAARWQVAFMGFAPGFGYLVGEPRLTVTRRSTPRTRIPQGSVGLAGPFSGVYPRASPGGWQLIGRTDAALWDLDRDEPALLAPGRTVRFTIAPPERIRAAGPLGEARPSAPASAPSPSSAAAPGALEVVDPGPQLLIQDLGRPGRFALGVGVSGAADRAAMRRANRAVGNATGAAVLEQAGGGAVLRFHAPGVAVITGACADDVLARPDGTSAALERGRPFAVGRGDELCLGVPARGLRSVVAVRGGIAAPVVLGSRATDTLAGLGPAPVRAGDRVPLGPLHGGGDAVQPDPAPEPILPAPGDEVTVGIVLGPREALFTPAARATLTAQAWEVTASADRVGIRLRGAPLERLVRDELPSEGVVTGAIQVPPDGQPVLFLPDHPITGGYPVIAAVVDADLDLLGQLAPGTRLRFRATT